MFLYSLFYRLDTDSTMVVETPATITDQPRTVQKIINNHRLVHIQLKLPRRTAYGDRHIVPHDLRCNHGEIFALGRVHFPRHDRRARLIFRQTDFTDSRTRTGTQHTDIVSYLHQADCDAF